LIINYTFLKYNAFGAEICPGEGVDVGRFFFQISKFGEVGDFGEIDQFSEIGGLGYFCGNCLIFWNIGGLKDQAE
jgi:hypothetical protein